VAARPSGAVRAWATNSTVSSTVTWTAAAANFTAAASSTATSFTVLTGAVANLGTTWQDWTTTSSARWEAARAAARRVQAEQAEERRGAVVRARALLARHLSPTQRASLATRGWFEVTADSGRRYQIHRGHAGNVLAVDEDGRAAASYCIHPAGDYPDEDVMLAQKLWLDADEPGFLAVANVTPRRRVAAAA
jgi:hypothetical protein